MKILVYPGSFDPVTNGHLDVMERALGICDKLVVAVLINSSKNPVFTFEERKEMILKALGKKGNVEVESFSGLLIDFMKQKDANTIIRGLRAVSDFEKEFQMALLNKNLSPDIETLFMVSNVKYTYLSSSVVKEIAQFGGDISDLVPDPILDDVVRKLRQKNV